MFGGLLAAEAKLSLRVTTALAELLGIYHGFLNGMGMGSLSLTTLALLGLVSAVFALIALSAAFVVRSQAHWARTAVRVTGKLGCSLRFAHAGLGGSKSMNQRTGPPPRPQILRVLDQGHEESGCKLDQCSYLTLDFTVGAHNLTQKGRNGHLDDLFEC